MAKWEVVASKYLGTVEAETEEEAEDKGLELGTCHVSVCHQCAVQVEDPEITEVVAQKVLK